MSGTSKDLSWQMQSRIPEAKSSESLPVEEFNDLLLATRLQLHIAQLLVQEPGLEAVGVAVADS